MFQNIFDPESRSVRNACRKAAAIVPPVEKVARPLKKEPLTIVICMTPRSGSTYLGALLEENGFGRSREYFRVADDIMENFVSVNAITTYGQYVRRMINTQTRDDIFAVKVGWLQFAPVYYFGAYEAYFQSAKFIYLTRGDLLRQAISRYIGSETGYFHTTSDNANAHTLEQDVPMDFEEITRHLDYLVAVQAAWEEFFSKEGLSPLRLRYEDLSADPAAVLSRIAHHVGRPIPGEPKLETELQKVRNERNETLRDAYIAEVQRRRQTAALELDQDQAPEISI